MSEAAAEDGRGKAAPAPSLPPSRACAESSASGDPIHLHSGDALLLVDVQNDFLPGGSLPVRHGDHLVETANSYLARFRVRRLPVFASRDWHPPDHCSFRAQGGTWPPHCVAGTRGAAFPDELNLPPDACVISKAAQANRDAYSAFDGTPLAELLRGAGVARLFVAGLATDYCVFDTVKAVLALGYAVFVLTDAIASVNLHRGDGVAALTEMRDAGARLIRISDLAE